MYMNGILMIIYYIGFIVPFIGFERNYILPLRVPLSVIETSLNGPVVQNDTEWLFCVKAMRT